MNSEQTHPAVMILGTFHFDNPGRDVINIPVDDMLGERRQAEIADVVARLAQFAPTAVALEIEPTAADTFNQRYRDYRAGTFVLTANEIYQLGFRVAAECHLPQIHGIDWQGPFGFEAMAAFAQTHGQEHILAATMSEFQREGTALVEALPRETVRTLLNSANDPVLLTTQHSYYLRLARIGADAHYPGVDLLRDWYHRNLMIFANMLRLLDDPQTRLLVMIGAGHAPLLQQCLRDLGTCEVAPVARYLCDAAIA